MLEAEEATASGGDPVARVTTGCQSQQDLATRAEAS